MAVATITATVSPSGTIQTGFILDEAGVSVLDEAGAVIGEEDEVIVSGATITTTVT